MLHENKFEKCIPLDPACPFADLTGAILSNGVGDKRMWIFEADPTQCSSTCPTRLVCKPKPLKNLGIILGIKTSL